MFRITKGRCSVGICAVSGLVLVLLYLSLGHPGKKQDVSIRKKPIAKHDRVSTVYNHSQKQSAFAKAPGIPRASRRKYLDLKKLRKHGPVVLPSKDVLKRMSSDFLFKTYHSYIDNLDILCHRKLRMGNLGDGGWEVCDDEAYRPPQPCLVYSFGINNDFSFDDHMASIYQCQVFSFDPSMNRASYQRTPMNYFSDIGLSGPNISNTSFPAYLNTTGWKLYTLGKIRKIFGHTERIIDVLKMDVEFSEWHSLEDMVKSEELRHVRQLLVEYHAANVTYKHLSILKGVYDLGFRKFHTHKNDNKFCKIESDSFPIPRSLCNEVHSININVHR